MKQVAVKRGRSGPLWVGHPWLFSGAIEREEAGIAAGDVVRVVDADGKFIAAGFFNPASQIRVRCLTWKDENIDDELLARHIEEAQGLRNQLGLPSTETDAYRLVNSEGDGLPGLIIDRFADVFAVQFTSLGMKQREAAIFSALQRFSPRAIVEIGGGRYAELEGFRSETRIVSGALADRKVRCLENGLTLEVEPLEGQKTGMFLDQRDNRRRVAELGRGGRVLDVYTFAGSFALNALRHGATHAICVDSSARALERVRAHAALNQIENIETVQEDAFRFLEAASPLHYDVVVLDPPKFARAKKDLDAAMKGYQRLNTLGLNVCKPGGLLVTCSCSQLISTVDFERMLAAAAKAADRRVQILESRSQAPDHPVTPAFAEGRYLKCLICRVL